MRAVYSKDPLARRPTPRVASLNSGGALADLRPVLAAVVGAAVVGMAAASVVAGAGLTIDDAAASVDVDNGADSPRFDHSDWDRLLHDYVDEKGLVAYRRLQENDRERFYGYLEGLAQADPADWPEPEQLAFWINAYNSMIIAAVLEGQSAESLIGRGKIFKLWKFPIAGKDRSLDEVEHDILRKRFEEPRLHFAIVCASASCPPLRAEAFSADRLDGQLEDQGRRFLNDPMRNALDLNASRLHLSKIFDWFKGDFERNSTLVEFIAPFVASPPVRLWLEQGAAGVQIDYLGYDWTLNAQPDERPQGKKRPPITILGDR